MSRAAATRQTLLALRARRSRVERGAALLRRRREALVTELFRLARPAVAARDAIARARDETGLPATDNRTSPGTMPALSAGLPRMTPAMMAPAVPDRRNDSASSGDISWTSTPIQPRVTEPFLMICSMTLFASETGMAKPMPIEPPLCE